MFKPGMTGKEMRPMVKKMAAKEEMADPQAKGLNKKGKVKKGKGKFLFGKKVKK